MASPLNLQPALLIGSGITDEHLRACSGKRLSCITDEEYMYSVLVHFGLGHKQSYELTFPAEPEPSSQKVQTFSRRKNVRDQLAMFYRDPASVPSSIMDKNEYLGILSGNARGDAELSEAGQIKSLELLGRAMGWLRPEQKREKDESDNQLRATIGRVIDQSHYINKEESDENPD